MVEAHKEPVLGVDLKERSAYRAIFTEGATVTELAENKSGSIAKAQANAENSSDCAKEKTPRY